MFGKILNLILRITLGTRAVTFHLILSGTLYIVGARLNTLNCVRASSVEITCELTSLGVLGKHKTVISSGQLKSAELESDQEAVGDTGQLILITQNDRIFFPNFSSSTFLFSNKRSQQEKVNQINTFISNPAQTSLMIQQDVRGQLWFGVPLFTIGLLSISKTVIFNGKRIL